MDNKFTTRVREGTVQYLNEEIGMAHFELFGEGVSFFDEPIPVEVNREKAWYIGVVDETKNTPRVTGVVYFPNKGCRPIYVRDMLSLVEMDGMPMN